MPAILLDNPADRDGWFAAARRLDREAVPPEAVSWRLRGEPVDLFTGGEPSPDAVDPRAGGDDAPARRVSRRLKELLDDMLLHADPARFALAYRILWRSRACPALAEIAADPDIARAEAMAKAVRRDLHKMKAFVRFRRVVAPDDGEAYIAWHEPEHHVTRAVAPFFARRFANMRWSILTPGVSVHWDGAALTVADGAQRSDAPDEDRLEDVWKTYYASIFNPARLKVKAMTAEMPRKFWRNLPEAELIVPLIRSAEARSREMVAAAPTLPRATATFMPGEQAAPAAVPASLADIAAGLRGCRRCPLHCEATQAVPGEGAPDAPIMIVGEQPGDQEDLAGRPFVGPAGQVLDKALERVGIDRSRSWLTNAVKHFKFEPRGKRRIHQSPNRAEIAQCRWWLAEEVRLVKPRLIVALGASAAFALTGRAMAVREARGMVRPIAGEEAPRLLVTVHPSYLLRLTDRAQKVEEWSRFLADLGQASSFLKPGSGARAATHPATPHIAPAVERHRATVD